MARNRVFLCIVHCCTAMGRFFVAFLEAQLGNHPPEVARELPKNLYRNWCGVRLGHRTGRRPTTCSGPGNKWRPCLHTSRRTPRGKRLWGCEHCYTLCTRQFRLCHALRADRLLLRFGNTPTGSRGRTICCSSKRIVIQCLRVRMHAGWELQILKSRSGACTLGVTSCPPSRTPYTRDLTIFYISTLSMLFDVCDQSCWQSCVTPVEIRVDVLVLCTPVF